MPWAPAAAPTPVAPNPTLMNSRLYPSLLPLQEAPNGDLRATGVHFPFPLGDLRQIKLVLESFTEDPENYISVFQGLNQSLKWHER